MSASFHLQRIDSLPGLAWLFESPMQGAPNLFCGSGVICEARGFFEGAWSGPFDEFAFHRTPNVFGSGVRFEDGEITIVTPTPTLESVVLKRTPNGWLVSNSLPFLLTHTEDRLRPGDWSYGERFARILDGVPSPPQTVPTEQGEVTLLFFHNARIGSDGQLRIVPKPLAPPFPDYDTYVDYLRREIGALARNASDAARPVRFRPLVTISSGYDSTAAAVLASEVGCKDAASFRYARGGNEDSGEAAATALGLTTTTLERLAHTRGHAMAEVEFLAGGIQGEDVFMTALEELIPERLLFSGFIGGTSWEPHASRTDPQARKDLSGGALGEFRLRTGFVHCPPAAIGLLRSEDLDAISGSEELRPFSVGGGYDRPLPRRLAEEAGVPREAFGNAKRAASVHLFLDASLWSEEAARAVEERRDRLPWRNRLHYRWRAARFRLSREFRRWASRFQQLLGGPRKVSDESLAGRLFERIFGARDAIVEHSHPRNTLLQDWALDELRPRYSVGDGPKA